MRRARLTAALAAAAVACAGLSGAMAQKLPNAGRCDVRIVPGPDSDESGCHLTEWSLPDGSGMAFHACPNRAGMEGVQKRLAAGEDKRTVLPDGNDRVLMGWSVEESSDPRWAAVTFDEKGNVNGGMLRDTKRTLFQVERSRSGQLLCVPNPDEIKLPGIDVHVEPGKDATEHHPHDHDGPDHFHDDHDGEWIEKAHHGRKLAKAYPTCPRWSTLAMEVIVELDREYIDFHGNALVALFNAANTMNLVAANYESQIGIEMKLNYHIESNSDGTWGWQYANTDPLALLQEFRNRWETTTSLKNKRRGIVHLLTDKDLDGSVIGIAYVDVACDSIAGDKYDGQYEYGISQATQATMGCDVGLIMHEIGHNAGSNHVSGAVMNPWLTCSNTFSASAISQIENHMNNHVPGDGKADGCWCERFFIIRELPWWWKYPWKWFGPFMEVPENPLPQPGPKEPFPEEKPFPEKPGLPGPKDIPGDAPGQPGAKDDEVPPTLPPGEVPPTLPPGEVPPTLPPNDPPSESKCSRFRRKKACKRKGRGQCEWVGKNRKLGIGGCVPSSETGLDEGPDGPAGKGDDLPELDAPDMCHNLRRRQCRRSRDCRFDRRTRTCVPK